MAGALQKRNEICAKKKAEVKKGIVLAERKLVFKNKKKGISAFADKGFNTLMALIMKMMMT